MPLRIAKSGAAIATFRIIDIDNDAFTFLTAAGITNTTQRNAINKLVIDLKYYGLWTKQRAIYPVVGGVAASHAVNLKTPGTYNLTFSNGWTHSSTGMTPAVAYAETGLIAQSVFPTTSIHLSTYSRTQIIQSSAHRTEIGAYDGTNFTGISQQYDGFGKFFAAGPNNASYQLPVPGTIASAVTTGLQIGNRLSNVMKVFQNGTEVASKNVTNSSLSTNSFFIGAYKNQSGGYADYSNRQLAFASIGDGLTDTDALNFYNIVQRYQTNLSRQV